MTVLLCNHINLKNLQTLLERYDIKIVNVAINETIPGSFWQPPEAGLIKDSSEKVEQAADHILCHGFDDYPVSQRLDFQSHGISPSLSSGQTLRPAVIKSRPR